MKFYTTLIYLLVSEVIILGGLAFAIISHRAYYFFKEKIDKNRKELLSIYLMDRIEKKELFDWKNYPGKRRWRKAVLEVIEAFSRRFEGGDWVALRNAVSDALLLPKARDWALSPFWLRKNFSARVFALHAEKEDEKKILNLMNDRRFLIRSPASLAAIRLESNAGIERILYAISTEVGFAKFFYRDALLQGSKKVAEIIVELAANPLLHQAALDILGGKSWGGAIPFLKEDLGSDNPEIRLLALRVLIRNILPDSFPFFEKGAKDPDSKVRATAMEGLNLFPEEESVNLLVAGLSDPSWEVRVEAGKGLKKRGERGIEILRKQTSPIAKEAAQFALEFG